MRVISMDLSYFEHEVEVEGELTTEIKPRPETKTQADLDRVIALNKSNSIISKFAEMVGIGEQWEWLDNYLAWEKANEEAIAYNSNLPIIGVGEDGFTPIYAQPKPQPTEPVRPPIRSGSEILAPYARGIFKQDRHKKVSEIKVTVDDMVFDGDEDSQNRMARAFVGLDDGESMSWVLHDNSLATVTKEQLKQALRLAGEAQTLLWSMD